MLKNHDTESVLRLKTTIPNLSYVKYRAKPMILTKSHRKICRFWLEKTTIPTISDVKKPKISQLEFFSFTNS